MAKYRHRIFEMYEFRDEAIEALTPKSARPVAEANAPESWTFKHLAVSCPEGVTHVEFRGAENFGVDTLNDLRQDLEQLADKSVRDSKVLFDFTGVTSFSAPSIDALAQFNRKLQTKGSRIALCCLAPTVHATFF